VSETELLICGGLQGDGQIFDGLLVLQIFDKVRIVLTRRKIVGLGE
jgi:hypothetical protein